MKTYLVTMSSGPVESVAAATIDFDGSTLFLRDDAGSVVAMFAVGVWTSVTVVPVPAPVHREVRIYDIYTDEMRAVTQEDVERLDQSSFVCGKTLRDIEYILMDVRQKLGWKDAVALTAVRPRVAQSQANPAGQ